MDSLQITYRYHEITIWSIFQSYCIMHWNTHLYSTWHVCIFTMYINNSEIGVSDQIMQTVNNRVNKTVKFLNSYLGENFKKQRLRLGWINQCLRVLWISSALWCSWARDRIIILLVFLWQLVDKLIRFSIQYIQLEHNYTNSTHSIYNMSPDQVCMAWKC